jgi:hypothetical protein
MALPVLESLTLSLLAEDPDNPDSDESGDEEEDDSTATLSKWLQALELPALVSLRVEATYLGKNSLAYHWDPHAFGDFIARSMIQTQLQSLSLEDVEITEEDVLSTLKLVPNLQRLKIFPFKMMPRSKNTPYALGPWFFICLTQRRSSLDTPLNNSSGLAAPLLPNLTHLSVKIARGDNGKFFSKTIVMKKIANMARSRLAGHECISRLIELEVFGFTSKTPDPLSVLDDLTSLRLRGLYCHGEDW